MIKASFSIEEPQADLCVLDLGEAWEEWRKIAAGVIEPTIRVRTSTGGVPPPSELLVITMPPTGLTAFEREVVRLGIESSGEVIFAARVGADQLKEGDREEAGYSLLIKEVNQDFGGALIAIPAAFKSDSLLVQRFVNAALQKTRARASLSRVRQDLKLLAGESDSPAVNDDFDTAPIEDFSSALAVLAGNDYATAALELRILALDDQKRAIEEQRQSDAELRIRLPRDARSACDRLKSKSFLGVGDFTIELTRGLAEVSEAIQHGLRARDWVSCKIPEFVEWRKHATGVFASPEITVPVVGRFSSGKTTLLNNFLGLTPGGHHYLRTAFTHNTAMLARFFHCAKSEQRVEFTYRDRLEQQSLCELGAHSERAIHSPCNGVIRIIRTARDSTTTIILEEEPSGRPVAVHLSPSHPPRKDLREGVSVTEGQPLSRNSSSSDLERQAIEHGDALISVDGQMIGDILALIDAGKLVHVEFHASFLAAGRSGKQAVVSKVLTSRDKSWMEWLERVLRHCKGSVWLSEIEGPYSPTQISFSADVNAGACIKRHPLLSDDDWNWFQGPAGSPTESLREQDRGFAESVDAELIIDEARLFLNNPLFELLNLVDTPGLNSICRRHSMKTEEFIERGTAFLVVLQLHKAGSDRSIADLFRLIRTRLDRLTANRRQARSNAADHVFVLLNRWDGLSRDDNWHEQLDRFTSLIREPFGELPPIYMADLKAQSSPGAAAETLWGQPSLADLFHDLRRYVATKGLDRKLEQIAIPLDEAARSAAERVRNMASDVDKRSQAEKLSALRKARTDLLDAEARCTGFSDSRIAAVNEAASRVRGLAGAMNDKDGFSRAGRQKDRLHEFNEKRDKLREITSYQQRELSSAIRNVVSVPLLEEVGSDIDRIPVLAPYTFSNEIDSIVSSWPGFWKGIGSFFKRVLDDFDFTRHATIQRSKIQNDHFQPLGKPLETSLKRLDTDLTRNLRAAVRKAGNDIDERERTLLATEAGIADERAKAAALKSELSAFQKTYKQMKELLRYYRQKMQTIAKEEQGKSHGNRSD